ncbi:Tripartite-type tricarboxylate transporter, receptor component TctC [Noviherbaspirillum humi]|uniref:Tripartite-type tricarboxylate transporter, receptor component TctC n=1 Tax=Noviherbaspirillum humi TaxID=1688639 RepID=A0A239IN73_9BURK|nr:tripartite tricarboxylate transporter substrate binding protein [Noviherbaspirillum humi]SNS94678.1 Tripartite-type tricarboxylate transporter, receptor component TctC [Noviherbaspirillum humi]
MKTANNLIKTGLRCLIAGAALVSASAGAQSNYPNKPVRIIVPFSPGGTADMLGRLVAQKLTESMKQTFVVENRGGAGGVVGSDLVAKAAPDGYTLVVSGVASHAIAPTLSKKMPFDPIRDFTHIALFGGPPSMLAVHPSVPAKDLKSFVALAKSKPGELSYASPGNGTMGHLAAEQFKQLAKIDMTHVPYKGAGPAVADLIAGHVPAASNTLSTMSSHVKAGKARALAVSSKARVEEFPDVPTFAELGYPEMVATIWFSLSGPKGMPQDIVNRLNAEVVKALQAPDVREKLKPEGIETNNMDAKAFTQFVAAELKRWAPVVKASGAQVD